MSDIHTLCEAYVLGAVTPAEAEEFEQHLTNCATCSAEVAELRDVTARLSEAVATHPPPALRSTILAAIAATPQERASASTAETSPRRLAAVLEPTPDARADAPVTASSPERETPRLTQVGTEASPRRRDQTPRRWTALLVAATVLTAVGFGGWALQSRQQASELRAQNEQVVQQSRQQASELSAQNEQVAQQNQQFTELLSAEDVRAVSSRFTSGGTGAVLMSRSRGEALLIASDLPDLPTDKVYQAWTIETDPVPAGTFSDTDGPVLELPEAAFDAQSVAVTIEPAGGSDRPTSDAVFTVSLPQR